MNRFSMDQSDNTFYEKYIFRLMLNGIITVFAIDLLK